MTTSSRSADWQPNFASEDSGAEIRIYGSESGEDVKQLLETPSLTHHRNVKIGKSPELTRPKNIQISVDCLEEQPIGCHCTCTHDGEGGECTCEQKECCPPPKKKKCAQQQDDSALCLCVILVIFFIIILAAVAHWGTAYSGYYHHYPHQHPHPPHNPIHYTY